MEALYDLYADRLYRYFLARIGDMDVAADLTAELFIRVIKAIPRFRLNRKRPAASFSAWLYRIAANLITDHHRAASRIQKVDFDSQLPIPADTPDPHRHSERLELAGRLATAMTGLSEDQRLVVIGKFGDGMSNAEIARWLGKTEGAVKSLQHRALRALGRILGSEEL